MFFFQVAVYPSLLNWTRQKNLSRSFASEGACALFNSDFLSLSSQDDSVFTSAVAQLHIISSLRVQINPFPPRAEVAKNKVQYEKKEGKLWCDAGYLALRVFVSQAQWGKLCKQLLPAGRNSGSQDTASRRYMDTVVSDGGTAGVAVGHCFVLHPKDG